MDLKKFSKVNRERCTSKNGFNHDLQDWSTAEWTNAVAGEAGEACNFAKKLLRHRDGVGGNYKESDKDVIELEKNVVKELADVIIYADLTIQKLGFNTSDVLKAVFNNKSLDLKCAILYED